MPTGIIEEPFYAEQINKLKINWKRLDDAFLTLEQAILQVPDIFPKVPGTQLRRVQLIDFPGVPALSIYFAVKDNKAHLVAAELITGEE
jgi:hypothetical protein